MRVPPLWRLISSKDCQFELAVGDGQRLAVRVEESIDVGRLRWEYCRPKGDRNAPISNAGCVFGRGLGVSGEESAGPHASRAPAHREHGRKCPELLVQLR